MNVSLTPELEQLVSEKVATGMYTSASEVIREALRLLKERDDLRQVKLDELRREIQLGLADLDEGRFSTYDDETPPDLVRKIQSDGRKRRTAQKDNAGV